MGNKKLLRLIAMLLPAFMFFSCSESDPVAAVPGDVVRISVALPEIYDLETRSTFGDDITGLNRMQWSVFEVSDNDGVKRYAHVDDGESDISVSEGESTQNIDLTLMRGKRYVVAVCVSHNDNEFAEFKEGKIKVNYDNSKCNDNSAEMFAGCSEEFSSDDAEGVAVELTRPFAQVNWGSSDLEDPTVTRHLPQTKATVTVSSQLYTVRDVVTGALSEPVEGATLGEVACSSLPTQDFPSVDASVSMNKLVAMNYLLAGDEESTINCKITFTGNLDADVTANSAAIRANYRTNIYGDFLTFPEFVNITLNSGWKSGWAYYPGEAKAIWDNFKSGSNLEVEEGRVLDLTNYGTYNVKNGQKITINGILKLHSQQLNFNDASSANYEIDGNGILYISNNFYFLICVTSGNLKISNIKIKSESSYYDKSQFLYISGSSAKVELENVSIITKYNAIRVNSGNLKMNKCRIEMLSKSSTYDNRYAAIHVNGGNNTIIDSYIDSFLRVTAGSSTFDNCKFKSSLKISSGTNTFDSCNIDSFAEILGGTSTFNSCVQGSFEPSLLITNGTCFINGGSFKYSGTLENTATIILDGTTPKLTITNGDFYSNSDYSILRITDELKKTIVADKNKLDEYANNKLTIEGVTQEMLEAYTKASVSLKGGRFEKPAYNTIYKREINAAVGHKKISWDESSNGFQIVSESTSN